MGRFDGTGGKEMKLRQGENMIQHFCEYECSKYCEIVDLDMGKVNDRFCCKACYNCAVMLK